MGANRLTKKNGQKKWRKNIRSYSFVCSNFSIAMEQTLRGVEMKLKIVEIGQWEFNFEARLPTADDLFILHFFVSAKTQNE